MGCNGCQALIGDYAIVESPSTVSITSTGLGVQELARVTLPPSQDVIELEGEINVAAAATATVAHVAAYLLPASNLNALAAWACSSDHVVPFTDASAFGKRLRVSALLLPDDYPAGDWVLGVNRPSTGPAANVIPSVLHPVLLRWRR